MSPAAQRPPATRAPAPALGSAVLVFGAESLLAERAVSQRVAAVRREVPEAELVEVEAADLVGNRLTELTGGSLFAPATVAIVRDLGNLPPDLHAALVEVASQPGPDLCLVLVHGGGTKAKSLVDALRKAGVERVEAAPIKAWEVPGFAVQEARHQRLPLDQEAAQALVDAVGADLRTIVGAIAQLKSDAGGQTVTAAFVTRYFAGRAEVTSFAVTDEVLRQRRDAALEKLRWALGTGVAPVLVTSAVAASLRALGKYHDLRSARLSDAEVAREIEVPPWKVKDLARQSRMWTAGAVSRALRRVARADADVKGAASDAEFALEQMVLDVIAIGETG
ncbi:MAG TPA: DNA polymerase III subunit delta [Propionibacteriaceae bacterium]|nr:DNA polymerase III subunit delta [Propionibacteriaceae bacterium]